MQKKETIRVSPRQRFYKIFAELNSIKNEQVAGIAQVAAEDVERGQHNVGR